MIATTMTIQTLSKSSWNRDLEAGTNHTEGQKIQKSHNPGNLSIRPEDLSVDMLTTPNRLSVLTDVNQITPTRSTGARNAFQAVCATLTGFSLIIIGSVALIAPEYRGPENAPKDNVKIGIGITLTVIGFIVAIPCILSLWPTPICPDCSPTYEDDD